MFSSDWSYNHRPKDHEACCPGMKLAIEKTGSVTVLTNYKHCIEANSSLDVLDYCPWCATDLRPLITGR
jgi:hypothetical protein